MSPWAGPHKDSISASAPNRDGAHERCCTFRRNGICGLMSADEAARFAALPYHADAVLVRRCDDRGKVAGLAVPRFEDSCPSRN
jgi:predicted HD phosphohydrolase